MSHTKKNPSISFQLLLARKREKGYLWILTTISEIIRLKLDKTTRPIRSLLWKIPDKMKSKNKGNTDTLFAFYDLEVSPATFDIVKFLLLAELERKRIGCQTLHVLIVPGSEDGFRKNDLDNYRNMGGDEYEIDTMLWRGRNILVPCCSLIPSCAGVSVCTSRDEAKTIEISLAENIFPKGYNVRFPKEKYDLSHLISAVAVEKKIPSIKATPQALKFVRNWIINKAGSRKIISITLRECEYESPRNSNLNAWEQFIRNLDTSKFFPVVIRDTEAAFNKLPPELNELTIFFEASWNIEIRAALYELSYVCMTVNSGPNALAIYNRNVRCVTFKMITPTSGATTDEFFRSRDLEPGSQPNYAGPLQSFVWGDDNLENIEKAFEDMCNKIETKNEA